MTEAAHVLVVDDDSRLRDLLRRFLSDNGFRVTVAADAADARQRLGALEFDLIVLDVMMPGESGLDLARALHDSRAIPILMLTAMGEPDDRIAGLESGVDDYLVKPFEPRELLLRLRTILRRARSVPTVSVEEGPASAMVRFGEHIFDIRQTILYRAGRPVRLTEAEAGMLRSFAEAPGETLSRETLAERNGLTGNMRTVDVQITRLRRKLEKDPKFPRFLQTVRGKGYVLRVEG